MSGTTNFKRLLLFMLCFTFHRILCWGEGFTIYPGLFSVSSSLFSASCSPQIMFMKKGRFSARQSHQNYNLVWFVVQSKIERKTSPKHQTLHHPLSPWKVTLCSLLTFSQARALISDENPDNIHRQCFETVSVTGIYSTVKVKERFGFMANKLWFMLKFISKNYKKQTCFLWRREIKYGVMD